MLHGNNSKKKKDTWNEFLGFSFVAAPLNECQEIDEMKNEENVGVTIKL